MAARATAKPKSDVAYLCRALKAPSRAAAVERLAERARAEGWTHEEFLAACLEREVASRQDHGGENRIRAAPGTRALAAIPRPAISPLVTQSAINWPTVATAALRKDSLDGGVRTAKLPR